MNGFCCLYVPVGVGTFELASARAAFEASKKLLRCLDPDIVCPDDILLTVDALDEYLLNKRPDLVVFQNVTFANGEYMTELLRRYDGPLVLWTLREPVIDGGRLRLNSLNLYLSY